MKSLHLLMLLASVATVPTALAGNLTLRYDLPAKYFEEALPIGNGNLGAMVYGRDSVEKVSLNDITLWTGEPDPLADRPDPRPVIEAIRTALDVENYALADSLQRTLQGHYAQNYQPLGTLRIAFTDRNGTPQPASPTAAYERTLDISRALATTRSGERTSQVFASMPDSVIALRISDPKGIYATLSLESKIPTVEFAASADEITADGYAAYTSKPGYSHEAEKSFRYDPSRGIHFRTILKVIAPKGTVTAQGSSLRLNGCKEATVLITNVTSFNGYDRDPVTDGRDYKSLAQSRIDKASRLSWSELQSRAEKAYRQLFDRVSLDLGATAPEIAALTTDRQLLSYCDNSDINPDLEELYFQFGRYLLISCSQTPGVPANLQGLWNEQMLPPWSSDYTTNINAEENYWGAELTNLSEMHHSLLGFVDNLQRAGRHAARTQCGVDRGWCLGHNTDMWAMANMIGEGNDNPQWANWPMGGAWMATHIWEAWLFNRDRAQLEAHYPALKGAAEFCLGWLIDSDGTLITSPSTSPEHSFKAPDGHSWPTMKCSASDMALIRECLTDARDAAVELGRDSELVAEIYAALPRLQKYQIRPDGALQEWYLNYPDEDPHHRHQSHMIGLYPGHHISVDATPELAAACSKALDIRGSETTGWSAGWRVNLRARLREADKAYAMYRRLLRYVSPDGYKGPDRRRGGGTYPNLFDAHTPFQIDGNFGGSAGVAEMLVQSTPTSVTLLPALPKQWDSGSVKGLRTRTGHTLDLTWRDGRVVSYHLTPLPNACPDPTVNLPK